MLRSFSRDGFASNAGGNVSIIFGLMIVPFISLAGLSIDYSNAVQEEASIQATLDAAALAAGRAFQASGDTSQAAAAASKYVESRRTAHPRFNLTTSDIDVETGTISLAGTSAVTTAFMGILGSKYDTLTVNAAATASLELGGERENHEVSKQLETIMSLTSAGSMRDGRRLELERAANDLAKKILSDHGGGSNSNRLGLAPLGKAIRSANYPLAKILEDAANRSASTTGRALSPALRNLAPGVAEPRLTE